MGIEAKFNPELALRPIGTKGRRQEECIPEDFNEGQTYTALKTGQRILYFGGEVSLRIYNGEELSRPIASIEILEATHFKDNDIMWTKVKYKVIKDLRGAEEPYFNGFEPIKKEADPNKVK